MSNVTNFRLFRRRPDASSLYSAIVRQARQLAFYHQFGIPDTVNGRFDLIALHTYIVMKRLKSVGDEGAKLSQALFDFMFADMERNLREMGVGDLSVGKQVKKMAAAYYGRVKAYDEALNKKDNSLEAALKRNIYAERAPSSEQLKAMVYYVQEQVETSTFWSLEDIEEVNFTFKPPPVIESHKYDN